MEDWTDIRERVASGTNAAAKATASVAPLSTNKSVGSWEGPTAERYSAIIEKIRNERAK